MRGGIAGGPIGGGPIGGNASEGAQGDRARAADVLHTAADSRAAAAAADAGATQARPPGVARADDCVREGRARR